MSQEGSASIQFAKSKIALFAKRVCSTILGVHLVLIFILHRYSSRWRRSIIFAHYIRWPPPFQVDLKKPQACNLTNARNFYLQSEDDVEVGVWQILPATSNLDENGSPEMYDECLGNGNSIIVYAHGNSGNRGSAHRLELYEILRKRDCHVIAFDYRKCGNLSQLPFHRENSLDTVMANDDVIPLWRSFGDSSTVPPDETGVVKDTITVIKWVLKRRKSSPIFVWGHSLGTGVSARAIKTLEEENIFVDGLILESPFNNLRDEIRNHPLGLLLKHMIGFEYLFIQPLLDDGISFRSDEYLSQCRVPVLILHAENDWIVPACLGGRLYKYLKEYRKDSKNIKYVKFESDYGHKWICKCPSLWTLIRLFMEQRYDEIPSRVD